jgi:FG-GAP repeat
LQEKLELFFTAHNISIPIGRFQKKQVIIKLIFFMKKFLLYFLLHISVAIKINAQGGIAVNTTGNAPASSAMLDVQSNNKGMLLPRMTGIQRLAIASPANGLLVYDADDHTLYMYDGYSWIAFAGQSKNGNTLLTESIVTDGTQHDNFGYASDVDGDYAVITAPWDTVNNHVGQGSAYVFKKTNGQWQQQAKLTAADGKENDLFGYVAAISGNHIIVGGNGTHKFAYVFERNANTWTEKTNLQPLDIANAGQFGSAVDIEDSTVIVGANSANTSGQAKGCAYAFTLVNNGWSQSAKIIAYDGEAADYFGAAVAIENGVVVIGAPSTTISNVNDAGCVYVFEKSGVSYLQKAKLYSNYPVADDRLGKAVAKYGNIIAAGASRGYVSAGNYSGFVCIFLKTAGVWSYNEKLTTPVDQRAEVSFGISLSMNGNYLLIGAANENVGDIVKAGAAYKYFFNGAKFVLQKRIADPNANFQNGFGVTVSTDGTNLIIGSCRYNNSQGKVSFSKLIE